MAWSETLFKICNSIFPPVFTSITAGRFADFMYILQLEEYSSKRLVKWLPRFFFRRNFQVREHLKYTKRVKLTLTFVVLLWLGSFVLVSLITKNLIIFSIAFIAWLIAIPVFVLVGNTLISPYFERIKAKIRKQAAQKVSHMPNLKIVAVAGSYGKTTVKNFIYQLVQYNYRTQMIPGNINTPAGIAAWVNANLAANTELLIAEVDAYEIGEIAKSCEVVAADTAILTNIGDQHLERFGNDKVLTEALSEVFTRSKLHAQLLTTQETKNKLSINVGSREWVIIEPLPDIHESLSASNQINLQFALTAARLLNVPEKFIQDTLGKLELPDRRQRLVEMYGFAAIDDSYNISFTTAQAGLAAARQAALKAGKKLLVVTAGIPELSKDNQDKNKELGKIFADKADHVIILCSVFAEEIATGMSDNPKYTKVKNLNVFLAETKNKFSANDWFLLMQPELGDLYY